MNVWFWHPENLHSVISFQIFSWVTLVRERTSTCKRCSTTFNIYSTSVNFSVLILLVHKMKLLRLHFEDRINAQLHIFRGGIACTVKTKENNKQLNSITNLPEKRKPILADVH
jgi:hypothetical protein